MKSVQVLVSALVVVVSLVTPSAVLAVTTPNFPSCSNPQGTIKVSYETGVHGIPGYPGASFSGKDSVYTLSTETLMQCFCSESGHGIQTNWWKVASLDPNQLNILKADGWNYVPNGAVWGLEEAAYMTKNADYLCRPFEQGGAPAGGGIGGSVLGASTSLVGQVLGLASTGNLPFIGAVFAFGAITLVAGILLLKRD